MRNRHFLFDAAIVLILGIVYRTRQGEMCPSESSLRNLHKAQSGFDASMTVFGHCAVVNSVVQRYWELLTRYKHVFDGLLAER